MNDLLTLKRLCLDFALAIEDCSFLKSTQMCFHSHADFREQAPGFCFRSENALEWRRRDSNS